MEQEVEGLYLEICGLSTIKPLWPVTVSVRPSGEGKEYRTRHREAWHAGARYQLHPRTLLS